MHDTPKHINRLVHETSPYLLQHAHNPVDWYPWGEEALARAKQEQKPILLSIGYSACHWCHVMERESFENEEIAGVMNELFINIKVDREERPDLDEIYMNAVQIMTRQGGWPMTVFLTPDLKPFYGGTYYPPTDRYGRPGFPKVMHAVSEAFSDQNTQVLQQAEQITAHLAQMSNVVDPHHHELTEELMTNAFQNYRSQFDSHHGGFGNAPKFPPSMGLPFLLRYWHHSGNANALEMVELTLEKMARGGMYDQLGGGFHRYSTDAHWLVPHFEKMLYDNAQLVIAYFEAYQATQKPFYRDIAIETLDYVLREMYDAENGGFYSTQDADSEGVEGKFFVWEPNDVEDIIGEENAEIFCEYYDITPQGNFEGENILQVQVPPDIFARKLRMDVSELEALLADGKQKLFDAREKRIKPGLDDKILTSWNGIMIRGMAMGYQLTGKPEYLEACKKSAEFVLTTLSQDNGLLLRTYRDGKSHLNAYLEDYSYFIAGLIALYEASFEPRWLTEAERLAHIMIDQFGDDAGDGFFFTGKAHETLIVQSKSAYDGATPSGASMAIHSLLRLAKHLDNPEFHDTAVETLLLYFHQMEQMPSGSGQLLCELAFLLSTPKEIAIVGEKGDAKTEAMLAALHGTYQPNKIVALRESADGQTLPLLVGKTQVDSTATAYVCENYVCQAPTTDVEAFVELLQ
ncbi:thioredoxin domain-containing protein [Candidatus Poribacteria bacterium]|nr:thioredoxin domain-containing protein [Candidatus Poribacteria bacterium]MYK18193.1 thioredoxin domain-containing protein [Candidatus Poribacteria bacterium]